MSAAAPRLLDLFCGAGGAAMGYHRAGFHVTGVDHHPQPHYPFTFVRADALEYARQHGHEYAAIHASPPCQAYSVTRALHPAKRYPDLVPATAAALEATGRPYVLENVVGAPLAHCPVTGVHRRLLCGSMYALATPDGSAVIRRHRLFECTAFWPGPQRACRHDGALVLTVAGNDFHAKLPRLVLSVTGKSCKVDEWSRRCVRGGCGHGHRAHATPDGSCQRCACPSVVQRRRRMRRRTYSASDARAAMGCPWMPMRALAQAIPPAYTEDLGRALRAALEAARGVPCVRGEWRGL